MKRFEHTALALLTAILLFPLGCPAALTKTCLTGTAPEVVGDRSQIATVRALVDAACPCSSFDGSTGKTHTSYVRCASPIITAQPVAQLRLQCRSTVRKYYASSTCGRNPNLHAEPCVADP